MKGAALAVASASFVVAGLITYFVVRALDSDKTELALVVGAILGAQVGVLMHHRRAGAFLSAKIKAQLGLVLAATCVVLSGIMQVATHCFRFPEVSIPIGAVGCFVFPFVIANTLWSALEKSKRKDAGNG